VAVHVDADGDRARVRVVDDGPGIPADRRERIFEPFERAERAGTPGSVGLGLTVSRQLARLQGGELAYHHPGAESVFELVVPAVGADRRSLAANGTSTGGEGVPGR